MKATVEICAEGLSSAFAAMKGGAHRIELCEHLAVGGVTPSAGAIWIASRGNIPLHVLIRPRAGDFCYSGLEAEALAHDIETAKSIGSAGVVLGVLTGEGRIDLARMSWLIEIARPMSVTFHKAFDAARDRFEALDDLIELGVDRVLTSGGTPTAREGLPVLAKLIRRAEGRIAVMAGGSIGPEDVRPLIDTGLREIHVGSAVLRGGVADPSMVRKIVELANA